MVRFLQQTCLPEPASSYFDMFTRTSLLATVSLAFVVAATPLVVVRDSPISIPLIKRINPRGTGRTLLERDRARIEALHRRTNIDVTNELFQYIVNVSADAYANAGRRTDLSRCADQITVGDPPTECEYIGFSVFGSPLNTPSSSDSLILDTGSSNTWVGATTPYTPTSTSSQTGNSVVRPSILGSNRGA